MAIPQIKLNNGNQIPQIGLGLWQIRKKSDLDTAVIAAVEAGYRHFDTAQAYGNESWLPRSLKKAGLKREEAFITTKIWTINFAPILTKASFFFSLKNLKSDYVDLLLLHYPVTTMRRRAWRDLESIYQSGQARAIGVSNYTIRHLEQLLSECKVKPAVNQVELHVFLQQPELLAYCAANDIAVEAYSPLAHGYGLDDPVLVEIAKRYNKTPAQIMLRWCAQVGTIPLPKSINPKRIKENIAIFDFNLNAGDIAQLTRLNKNLHTSWDPTNTR